MAGMTKIWHISQLVSNSKARGPRSGPPSDYLALSPSYKNPAITRESKGLRLSISPNATWNSQMYIVFFRCWQRANNLFGRIQGTHRAYSSNLRKPRHWYSVGVSFIEVISIRRLTMTHIGSIISQSSVRLPMLPTRRLSTR